MSSSEACYQGHISLHCCPRKGFLAHADEQSDDDNSEASAESVGGTIDWDIPLKLPRSVLMAAQQAREAEAAASAAVRS